MASNLNGFLALCDFECSKKTITIQTFSNSWIIVPVQQNSHQQSRLNQHQSSLCITCLRSGRFRPSKHFEVFKKPGKSWKINVFYVKPCKLWPGDFFQQLTTRVDEIGQLIVYLTGTQGYWSIGIPWKCFNGFQWIYWIMVESNRFQSIKLFERKIAVIKKTGMTRDDHTSK